MPTDKVGYVLSSSPDNIVVEIDNLEIYEKNKYKLKIGNHLLIAQGNSDYTICIILNLTGVNVEDRDSSKLIWRFQIYCRPIGTLVDGENYEKGAIGLPVPTEPAFIADETVLNKIFLDNEIYNFPFGHLSISPDTVFKIDGDCFFSKHITIVGSTGSGKSCAVALLLQQVVGIKNSNYEIKGSQNNSHIILFDIHDEYKNAFTLDEQQSFTLNILDVNTLKIPYWLMNSEELENMFIESNEENSHNQVSQFKNAVIMNKEIHNPSIAEMTYDNPVYFSLDEVYQYIENMNREVIGRLPGEDLPKRNDGSLVDDRSIYFTEKVIFAPQSTSRDSKATNGPFYGQFNRFLSRLETTLTDKRLKFLLSPTTAEGNPYKSNDFSIILKQFMGYLNKSNITIVDLSGIPFEVLSIVVSLISRLIFDFCFHYSKQRQKNNNLNNVPVMIVCEEAHNYVPNKDAAQYRSSRKSIERIAKEGRKYGLNLLIVSQRPSEVSETIVAQCNNFISLRLTNVNDQNYMKRIFPDNSKSLTDILPNLSPGECIIVGNAAILPSIVQLPLPNPQPHSQSVAVYSEWNDPWKEITFSDIITRWRKE